MERAPRRDLDAIAGAGIPHKREPPALVVGSRRVAGSGARGHCQRAAGPRVL